MRFIAMIAGLVCTSALYMFVTMLSEGAHIFSAAGDKIAFGCWLVACVSLVYQYASDQ
jgi:hypothetical protein